MVNRGKSRWESLLDMLRRNGQEHLLPPFEKLPPQKQSAIIGQLDGVDLSFMRREVLRLRRHGKDTSAMKPASCTFLPSTQTEEERWERAFAFGEQEIRSGSVAVVSAAGGQSTRLGSIASKGMVPITPVRGKTLFQLFAERISACELRHGVTIPWLILTSQANREETVSYFEQNEYFNLREVHIFAQGQLPTMDLDGRLILASKESIATHSDGHGGLVPAMANCDLFTTLNRLGIKYLSYHQIDNPLAVPVDPYFIGFHIQNSAQMSSRCVRKAYAAEKVGVFVEVDGKLRVIEYMDLPPECASAVDVSNRLRFSLANVAMHIFDVNFLEQFHAKAQENKLLDLPLHPSLKRVPYLNAAGHLVRPTEANAVKLERFIFDLLPHAERTLLLEGRREEIFSPIKNQAGLDSPETSRRDQVRQFANWLARGKVDIIRDADGTPPFPIEIAPSFANSAREFVEKWSKLDRKPAVVENFYLA
ncbi:MAG: UTP--glucose-1-phosphate uridylyltransferase [Puniceicoccales bacterium]|jgi:UDP-N-acetylglucosamine/UDP-N-acetylgalactosamine diphosphorylase|nr:UTP--glucose-1-phosphate uridylyltransferase [Puniceicoccales bacterium]